MFPPRFFRFLTMRVPAAPFLLVTLSLALIGYAPAARAQTPVFTPLGDLPGGIFTSYATGVSDDGTVVVGQGSGANGGEAFRWTAATGMVGLGDLPGGNAFSYGAGISGNGSVLVGQSFGASIEAFRWTAATGLVSLGDIPGGDFGSSASGVSSDGSVVVGYGVSASSVNNNEASRWTAQTGMVGLGDIPGGPFASSASGVSSDGSVVVGASEGADGVEAFRWTAAGGMVRLGDLPGGPFNSLAHGVSGDGLVVVGYSQGGNGVEAFRWTSATGMAGLGDIPGGFFSSQANGVSGNGSVVVGNSSGPTGFEAFLWKSGTGMVSLKQHLLSNYASYLPADFDAWTLSTATSVSADGTAIVGYGLNPQGETEAWLVRIPGGPSVKWTPIDVAVNRTDNTSRLLWKETTNRYAVWKVSATGAVQTGKYYGPVAGYACNQIAVAPNGQTTLLWKNPATKQAALWTLAADLSSIVKATVYNYPAGYTPQNLAADASSNIRLSWRRMDNAVALWTITPATGAVSGSAVYGPYANLLDGPIAVGADGRIRLLWRNTSSGGATLWTIPAAYGAPSAGYNYNAVAGATPADIAVGNDNKTRLQWRYTSGANVGKIAVWKINTTVGGTGAIEVGKFYGPIAGVSPLGLSLGGDNQTRQLWRYTTGKAALWVLSDPLTAISAAYTYGPIP